MIKLTMSLVLILGLTACGDDGVDGYNGRTGDTGQAGEVGSEGVKGDAGSQGITGTKGEAGESIVGNTGEAGQDGAFVNAEIITIDRCMDRLNEIKDNNVFLYAYEQIITGEDSPKIGIIDFGEFLMNGRSHGEWRYVQASLAVVSRWGRAEQESFYYSVKLYVKPKYTVDSPLKCEISVRHVISSWGVIQTEDRFTEEWYPE